MSTMNNQNESGGYVRGPSRYRKLARLETKPTTGPRDTSGGYERIRSSEHRPTHPSENAVDVYAAVHQLLAVAWNRPRLETGEPILPDDYSGVVDMGVLAGDDVHHEAPELSERRGVEWDNREECLYVESHERHASLTNAERRAYGEDAKQQAFDDTTTEGQGCAGCGGEDVAATFDGTSEEYCLACAKDCASDYSGPVRLLNS